MVHSSLQPNVIAIEDSQGHWSFVAGEPFVRALLHFVVDKQTYKGLYFSEHSSTVRRKILDHPIDVALYDIANTEANEFKVAMKALEHFR